MKMTINNSILSKGLFLILFTFLLWLGMAFFTPMAEASVISRLYHDVSDNLADFNDSFNEVNDRVINNISALPLPLPVPIPFIIPAVKTTFVSQDNRAVRTPVVSNSYNDYSVTDNSINNSFNNNTGSFNGGSVSIQPLPVKKNTFVVKKFDDHVYDYRGDDYYDNYYDDDYYYDDYGYDYNYDRNQNQVLAYTDSYQPPMASAVYLSQVPYTGFADNMKLYLFTGLLALFSAWVAYIVISYRKYNPGLEI